MITPYPDLTPPASDAVLRPEPPRLSRGGIEFRARLDLAETSHVIWFRSPLEGGASFTARADPFVLAVLPLCMRRGLNLEVNGCVTRGLLQNLADYQDAFACYHRGCRRIEITTAGEMPPPTHARRSGLLALSAGLNSAFSLYRHSELSPLRPKRPVAAVLLVHGLDVPLGRTELFAGLRSASTAMARSVGVPLVTVETNLRELPVGWRELGRLATAAALTLFQEDFSSGLVGAVTADAWLGANHPAAPRDSLLSSDAFGLVEDGAGVAELDKLRHLATWPTARRHLRVCRTGNGRNCCRCERCLHTMMLLDVIGAPMGEAFPSALSAASFQHLVLTEPASLSQMAAALREARQRGICASWVRPARWCVLRSRWRHWLGRVRTSFAPRPEPRRPTPVRPRRAKVEMSN